MNRPNTTIRFSRVQGAGFSTELRKRINEYFKENQKKIHGNWGVYHKTIIWHFLYLAPYVLILNGILGAWANIGLAVLMGVAMCGIGLNVMHDANHGTFARKKWLNKLAGGSLVLMGGNPFTWRMQHNVLHHTYTNIQHKDEDIAPRYVLKFCPQDKTRWFHRYQHIYASFFYALMTIAWTLHKDFVQLIRYNKMGLLKQHKASYSKEMSRNIAIKIFYFGYIGVLPLMISDLSFGQWLIGFLTMHFTAGLLLGLIFQSAHVVEDTENPMPDAAGNMEDEWMIHQLRTTANFANRSKWFTWFAGGLNFQVEHHLFPNISHIHYPAISKIVKQTAKEFNLPYHEAPSFYTAVRSHFRALKRMGRTPQVIPA